MPCVTACETRDVAMQSPARPARPAQPAQPSPPVVSNPGSKTSHHVVQERYGREGDA